MAEKARPNVRQRRVARTLREWRKSTGETLEETAAKLRWSVPKLSRFERAEANAGPAEIIALATILCVDDAERDETVSIAMSSAENSGWWSSYGPEAIRDDFVDYMETEAEANLVCNVEMIMIPGLLQTAEYAEALFRGWAPNPDEQQIKEKSDLRLRRQARLFEENPPLQFHAIVHESVLRQYIGGAEVMQAQLAYLAEAAGLSNIQFQLLPISIGAYPGFGISYHIIDLGRDSASAVFLDNLGGGTFVEEPGKIDSYIANFEYLSRLALDSDASMQLISATLKSMNLIGEEQ